MNIQISKEQRTIADQRVRIEELEEELRQIKEDIAPAVLFPRNWGLTLQQQRMLMAIYSAPGGLIPHARLIAAVDSNSACPADVVKVVLVRLRKKLAQFDIKIINVWGIGYEMPEASRAIVKAAIAGSAAA